MYYNIRVFIFIVELQTVSGEINAILSDIRTAR